jgi:DNA processing protein
MSLAGLTFDMEDDRQARAAWSRLAEPGDVHAAALIGQVGASEALRALVCRRVGWMERYRPRLAELDPVRDLRTLSGLDGRLVVPTDPEWPTGLGDLVAPPSCLWVRGPVALDVLNDASAAVVGARASSAYGEHAAGEIASTLAERGHVVVSGMAYGIDGTAHRAALAVDGGSVAVLAGGVDRPYPRGHDTLMRRLLEVGAVIAEVPPGSAPTRSRFLLRNRLIAAATRGTVVVEAARRSGALNTARTAAELGRPVGAVPGPVTSMMSVGCHDLVREGAAVLVTDGAEAAELVDPLSKPSTGSPSSGGSSGSDRNVDGGIDQRDELDEVTARVLDALPVRSGQPVDRLCVTAGLDPFSVQSALGRLALLGLAERHAHGWRITRAGRGQRA